MTFSRRKRSETAVVISGAVTDAVAAPVEAGEWNEQQVGFDCRGGLERLGDPHRAQPRRLARPPEAERRAGAPRPTTTGNAVA